MNRVCGPIATDTQIRLTADAAQAVAGKRVRRTSGAASTAANSRSVSVPNGWWCRPFWVFSQESVAPQRMSASTTSARNTRSTGPNWRRCRQAGVGDGGSVAPVATAARNTAATQAAAAVTAVTTASRRETPELMTSA